MAVLIRDAVSLGARRRPRKRRKSARSETGAIGLIRYLTFRYAGGKIASLELLHGAHQAGDPSAVAFHALRMLPKTGQAIPMVGGQT